MKYKNVSHLSIEELDHLKRCGLLWSRIKHNSFEDWGDWEFEDEHFDDWAVWGKIYSTEYQSDFDRIEYICRVDARDIGYLQAAILVETEE